MGKIQIKFLFLLTINFFTIFDSLGNEESTERTAHNTEHNKQSDTKTAASGSNKKLKTNYELNARSVGGLRRDMFWSQALRSSHEPFIKACGEDIAYEIRPASRCQNGVIFKRPYHIDCLCPFGVWIIKATICDTSTYVLIGDSNDATICFELGFSIMKLTFLGDPDDVQAEKAYITPNSMTVFLEIPLNGSWTKLVNFKTPVIIALFLNRDGAFENQRKLCFPFKRSGGRRTVQLWPAGVSPVMIRWIKKCSDPLLNFPTKNIISPDTIWIRSPNPYTIPVPKPHCPVTRIEDKCLATYTPSFKSQKYRIHLNEGSVETTAKPESFSTSEIEKYQKKLLLKGSLLGQSMAYRKVPISSSNSKPYYWPGRIPENILKKSSKIQNPIKDSGPQSPLHQDAHRSFRYLDVTKKKYSPVESGDEQKNPFSSINPKDLSKHPGDVLLEVVASSLGNSISINTSSETFENSSKQLNRASATALNSNNNSSSIETGNKMDPQDSQKQNGVRRKRSYGDWKSSEGPQITEPLHLKSGLWKVVFPKKKVHSDDNNQRFRRFTGISFPVKTPAIKAKLVFGGNAICSESYWDALYTLYLTDHEKKCYPKISV